MSPSRPSRPARARGRENTGRPAVAHAPLVVDIAGTTLSADDKRRLRHPLVGGMILFGRHWHNRRQLTELVAQAKALRPDLLVCVDHEGGRVQRFRTDGFTHLPPMRRLGELWMQDPLAATNAATAVGHVLAAELRACGVDLSFTPVLDLDHGHSEVIGDRAFARDARVVTILAQALMHGLLRAGMAHCGKHFPGHGYAQADSHVAVPVDRRSLKTLWADDALPYGRLSASLTAVMPAHVIYPRVDSRPAGFSSRWLQTLLRQQLGFQGAIFSDDLSMEGARTVDGRRLDYPEAAAMALNAGCDLVLLCNQSQVNQGQAVDGLIEGLAQLAAQGRWRPDAASEARRLQLLPATPALPWDELMLDASYRHALDLLP